MSTPILTIAAVNTGVGILPLILLVVVGIYWVIKHQKFSEALLTVAAVGGVISLIWGMALVGDHNHDGRLAGAVMIAAGLVVVALIGMAIRKQD